jgi:uncharacterized protein YjbJ (UPF0337 family)
MTVHVINDVMHVSSHREHFMNESTIKGNWKEMKGKVREQWGKLTDDDLDVIAGKRDQLLGKLQQSYGKTKDEAERELKAFESDMEAADRAAAKRAESTAS